MKLIIWVVITLIGRHKFWHLKLKQLWVFREMRVNYFMGHIKPPLTHNHYMQQLSNKVIKLVCRP